MDMMEFLRSRRTYRRFAQRAVAPEILTEAVDAARIASCGANRQSVRYCIVESPAAVAAVQPLVHWAAYLPREQGTPQPTSSPLRLSPSCRMTVCPVRMMWTLAWRWAA